MGYLSGRIRRAFASALSGWPSVISVLVTFSIGSVTISLSTSVGTLLAGLLVGYLRTHYPLFGASNPTPKYKLPNEIIHANR
jgi:hypothetical protein